MSSRSLKVRREHDRAETNLRDDPLRRIGGLCAINRSRYPYRMPGSDFRIQVGQIRDLDRFAVVRKLRLKQRRA